jgi:hypothetical protein
MNNHAAASGSGPRALALHRRAVEAVIWGMPAVNYQLMYEASARAGGPGDNQIVYWPGLLDWTNQTLTPNPDVIYVMPFFTTKDVGPIILEVPPANGGTLNGSIMNFWQAAIEDVGPAGIDEGRGGKCLILPPYFVGEIPDGYIPLRSDTYQGYGLIRSVLRSGSDADVAEAIEYAKQIRLYPLSQADEPPETAWVDASQGPFDAAIPYDLRFFEALDKIIQAEPWLQRDRIMIDYLRTIGIENGKPFEPDAETQQVLTSAIAEAHTWIDAEYESTFHPFNEDQHWALPASPEMLAAIESFFEQPEAYPVDARGVTYSFAFFSARHMGKGQFYLMTLVDSDGRPLEGDTSYRLRVPPDAPVTQYWSATVYNRDTHTLITNVSRSGRSSQSPGLMVNEDGSVDLFFSPTAPDGQDANWTPTDPEGRFEVLFRFYGPAPALFDRTWQLPDLEKVSGSRKRRMRVKQPVRPRRVRRKHR